MWRSAVQVCLGLHFCSRLTIEDSGDNLIIIINYQLLKAGGLAQLARAPALHAGGQRFESVILHVFSQVQGA